MSSFQQVLIGGYPGGGLMTDRKPMMLAKEAFSKLENAYVFRERTKKRDGSRSLERLTRVLSAESGGNINLVNPSPNTFNLFTLLGVLTDEPNAQVKPGSSTSPIIIVIGAQTLTDNVGTGTFTIAPAGNITAAKINYGTGVITITFTAPAGPLAVVITMNYYPSLPVMGILKRDVPTVGIDETVFFDQIYAYQFVNGFQELSPGTVWTGDNTDFFWGANFQGATPDLRYFFVTNNNILLSGPGSPSYDAPKYYDNSAWIDLTPLITATDTLYQALILVPYYGRMLALNTWEGTTAGTYTGSKNFFSRVRFSQIGDPTDQVNGWRSDIFGRGGFLDAPTNESIVSAAFFRNTLIVFFEYSTWQLRYIGEYGLPFIFERISSDFGAVSTYSPIIFDQGVLIVGDRGIIQSAVNGVSRIDDQIPETVFGFEIQNSGPNFVHGVRDFEKEVVYWNYIDKSTSEISQAYPNAVLLYNYRNNTWAQFRDTITAFGRAQFQFGITWDSLTTFWESTVSWDNVDDQNYVDYVTAGNQQGFITIYGNPDADTPVPAPTLYPPTLSIYAVDFSTVPNTLTIPNHNLAVGEIIYITGSLWDGTDPGINNQIYRVTPKTGDELNKVTLSQWDQATQAYEDVDITSSATYIGSGLVTLFPKMNIVGKDFNPFQTIGKQFKLSYLDFLMDSNLIIPAIPAVTVQLFVNSYLGEQANLITGNQELLNSSQTCDFIIGATNANPCVITSPDHSLQSGTLIYIANVEGMTQLNSALYTMTVIDADNFSLDGINSTGFGVYTKGGVWNSAPVDGQTYIPGSEYAWYRFYSTQFGQFLRVGITYDDNLMNQLATHQIPMELHAMNLWFRPGGRLVN